MKTQPLRLLLAEKSDEDASRIIDALKRNEFAVNCRRVVTAEDFRLALEPGNFDIILCDDVMLGLDALEILRKSGCDIPLVVVSSSAGEAEAVGAMGCGAADYVLKENLTRLGAVVEREIRAAGAASACDALLRIASQTARLGGWIADFTHSRIYWSDEVCAIHEMPTGTSQTFDDAMRFIAPEWRDRVVGFFKSCLSDGSPFDEEMQVLTAGDRRVWVRLLGKAIRDDGGGITRIQGALQDITSNKQAEAHLKLLESSLSRINDIVIITEAYPFVEPGPRIVYVNDAFLRNTGYTREEVIGRSPRFLQGPKTQVERLKLIRNALAQGAPVRMELINYRKNGEEFMLDLDIVPVTDAVDHVTHYVAIERDITLRKLAEEKRRTEERRLLKQRNALISLHQDTQPEGVGIDEAFRCITETTAKTLDVARVSIWKHAPDDRILECLDLYELALHTHSSGVRLAATDYPAYFEGLGKLDLIAADDACQHPLTREFSEHYLIPMGITSMMDAPIRDEKTLGHLLCCEHVGPVREWTEDEKTFAVAVASLVSLAVANEARTRAQQEVLRRKQLFKSVAAATNDTIWDWNLETDAFWWNDGFANLFGWVPSETETTIETWIRQIHPQDRMRVVDGIYSVVRDGGTDWVDEYRFVSNNGSISHVLDRGQVIRDAAGKGVRMVGGMMDLTAAKAAEAELCRSHRALQMLGLCSEMLVCLPDETRCLTEACRIAVEVGGYRMAWVGYAMNDEEKSVMPMAFAGAEDGYLSEIRVSWAKESWLGNGPAANAIRSGEIVVSEDFLADPQASAWHYAAGKRGFVGVICIPLRDQSKTFGVLCLYTAQVLAPHAEELEVLQQMANDLSIGVSGIRSLEEHQRTHNVVAKVAQAVSTGIGFEFFDLLTLNMVEALGALGGFVGRYLPEEHSVETLSLVIDGKLAPPLVYVLDGTPCECLLNGEICLFERDIQAVFPRDTLLADLNLQSYAGIPLMRQDGNVAGVMVVYFSSPMKDSSLVSSTLKIFAARAAFEMVRQQADARIREQASLLDKSRDAILVCDLSHKLTYWNKSAERLYGWTAEEVLGRQVQEVLYKDPEAFFKAHSMTLEQGEWFGEMCQYDKCGRELIIEGRWTLVSNEKNQPVSVFVINTDISEHRKLEQQFLRAQRMESLGTMAGGIAHDLNNILTPISMAVELLRMRFTDERSCELLDTVATSARRGGNMVGQVLAFARGREGRRLEVDVQRLIAEIEILLRDALPRNVLLDIRTGEGLRAIHGDPNQLHQVILNLCINARDAMPDGGCIRIDAENVEIDARFAAMNLKAKPGPHLLIRVEDTGEGIPPEIMDKLFDPFFTTKSIGKGTGLGLSTSLAIIMGHGGFIQVTSLPGTGSCFSVYLPASPESAAPALIQDATSLAEVAGEMILIVDDEQPIRDMTRQTLESLGFRTLVAADGGEAVRLFGEHRAEIDIVLTDMMMPVMDGTATILRLREIDPSVRIIVTSGVVAGRELAHMADLGVANFLPKPYTVQSLLKCVRKSLAETSPQAFDLQ